MYAPSTINDSKFQILQNDSLDALKNHYQDTQNLAGVRTEGNINLNEDDKTIYTVINAKLTELSPR